MCLSVPTIKTGAALNLWSNAITINVYTLLVLYSVLASMFNYWAFAQNKWLKEAYYSMIFNSFNLVYINWMLSAPGRVPVLDLHNGLQIELASDTRASNLFSALSLWVVISGIRGLYRLRKEKGDNQHV